MPRFLIGFARSVKRWTWSPPARIGIGCVVSVVLGWMTINGLDWGLVAEQFRHLSITWVLVSLSLMLTANVVKAYRWQRLFVAHPMPLRHLFLVQNVGIGINNLVPFRVVSEGIQYALLTLRYRVNSGVAIAALATERILDLIVTATVLMAGLTLIPGKGDFLPYVVGAFVVAMLSIVALPTFVWLTRHTFMGKLQIAATIVNFLLSLGKSKGAVSSAIALTILYWFLVGLSSWILAHGMGLNISPFLATLTILGTVYFSTSLPALPAAIGTFEFAIVYVLRVFNVPQDMAFSYGVIMHVILFMPPILLLIVALPHLGLKHLRKQPREQHLTDDLLPVTAEKGIAR